MRHKEYILEKIEFTKWIPTNDRRVPGEGAYAVARMVRIRLNDANDKPTDRWMQAIETKVENETPPNLDTVTKWADPAKVSDDDMQALRMRYADVFAAYEVEVVRRDEAKLAEEAALQARIDAEVAARLRAAKPVRKPKPKAGE